MGSTVSWSPAVHRREECRMFHRVAATVRVVTPIAILVAIALASEAGMRWW